MQRRIRVNETLLGRCAERGLTLLAGPGRPLTVGADLYVATDADFEGYARLVGPILPRAMGAFSYARSLVMGYVSIGRYCSIGKSLDFLTESHPYSWASTSPFAYDDGFRPVSDYMRDMGLARPALRPYRSDGLPTRIGNDVLLGNKVILKSGVTIGDGAIIGGGSVVTRDIPPYAVVGGAPARLIRYRFDPETIARFGAARWWRLGPDQLMPLPVDDPIAFLDGVEALEASGVAEPSIPRVTGADLIGWSQAPI